MRWMCLLALALSACGGSDDDGSEGDEGGGHHAGSGDPRIADGDYDEVLSGRYELTTTVDLTASGVLPDFARNTVRSLSRFDEAPSAAMLEILERSGVPILSTVLALVPTSLQEYLAGWMDEWVVGSFYGDVPIVEEVASLADEIGSLFTALDVVSILEVAPTDEAGATTATHVLSGVSFTIGGAPYVVDAGDYAGDPSTLEATAVHVLEEGTDLEEGLLDLGDHTLSVPVGPLALTGVQAILEARYGVSSVGEALRWMVDCDGMGAWIGSQCWLGVCVGNEAEIAELCGTALDEIGADVEAGVASIEVDAIHLEQGTARLWDDDADGTIDRVDDGFFRAALNLGAGQRRTNATFRGVRLPDPSEPPIE